MKEVMDMRSMFVLREYCGTEIIDPKNNIERLRKIRCLNSKRFSFDAWRDYFKVMALSGAKKRTDK